MLVSAKCKQETSSALIAKAEKSTTFGGVYGSGFTTNYEVTFSKQATEEIVFDSVWIAVGKTEVYKSLALEKKYKFYKNEEGLPYFNFYFQGGERMQPNEEIINIEIPRFEKPAAMEENEAIIFGKYGKKKMKIAIAAFHKKENINMP